MSINIFRKNSKNTTNVTIHLPCGIIIVEIKNSAITYQVVNYGLICRIR
jgi:hypothetical protein